MFVKKSCFIFLGLVFFCFRSFSQQVSPVDKSNPVHGPDYLGYIVPYYNMMGYDTPFTISAKHVALAEKYLKPYFKKHCAAVHGEIDSLDCIAMRDFKSYIRVYSGYCLKGGKQRFILIEAYEKEYFEDIQKGEYINDCGSSFLKFRINIDSGKVEFLGDGGWG